MPADPRLQFARLIACGRGPARAVRELFPDTPLNAIRRAVRGFMADAAVKAEIERLMEARFNAAVHLICARHNALLAVATAEHGELSGVPVSPADRRRALAVYNEATGKAPLNAVPLHDDERRKVFDLLRRVTA